MADDAVRELTDMDHIDDGKIECRLEEASERDGRRQARVTFAGEVRGGNEDGPNRQQLDGWYLFDLESNYLSYLYLKGVHSLLDPDGKEMGRIEGAIRPEPEGGRHEPRPERRRAEGVDAGAERREHPAAVRQSRLRCTVRVSRGAGTSRAVRGSQLGLDGADGSGLLITLDTPARTPTGVQFLDESRSWLEGRKVKVLRVDAAKAVAAGLEHFALETEAADQKAVMDYYVTRQANGGATLAARLMPDDAGGASEGSGGDRAEPGDHEEDGGAEMIGDRALISAGAATRVRHATIAA